MTIVDLSRNEMPEPPDQELLTRALSAAAIESHRYPADLLEELDTQVDRTFAAQGRRAILTRGVDDAIDSALRLHTHSTPLVFVPTFAGFLERFRAWKVPFECVPLDYDYRLPHSTCGPLLSGKQVFLANPNNPTGTVFSHDRIVQIAAQAAHLFLDETYIDFSGAKTAEPVVPTNTLLFRSFSKAYGLAGARLGVLSGAPADIEEIRRARIFCPIDVFSLHVLRAVLNGGADRVFRRASKVVALRQQAREALCGLGFTVPESSANFLIVFVGDSRAAMLFLREHGILVKDLEMDGLPGWLRISVGNNQHMMTLTSLLAAFRQITSP